MKKLSILWDILFAWLPLIIIIICCTIVLFPWPELNNGILNLIQSSEFMMVVIIISYTIFLSKNNFNTNYRIIKKIGNLKIVNADDFFYRRSELESLYNIFDRADSLSFLGGHLHAITQHDSLSSFLCRKKKARFLLPNPLNEYVISQHVDILILNITKEQFVNQVMYSLKMLDNYKNARHDIDFKVYDIMPSFGLQIIEAPVLSGGKSINVELFTMKTELANRVSFSVVNSNSGEMYDYFYNQFDELWKKSVSIENNNELKEALRQHR